ncbi:unnamed protein product [Caenorhabditis nigoni]|nr:hypothetical protein B9Z55_028266 [Caenorhabditis nigoni]
MQAISRLERQAQKQTAPAGEEECDNEEDIKSYPSTRTSSRAQRKPLRKPKRSTRSEEADLESSKPSDDEESRYVSSGSENDHDDYCRHARHYHKSARYPEKLSDLPKLETVLFLLPTFDGTGDWEEFHDTFYAEIMTRNDLGTAQKHKILQDHIIGSANSCVAVSKDHTAAIEATFENLERVYSQKLTKNKLLQKLNKLPFHQTGPEKMRLDLASIANLRMLLREKGVAANDDRVTMAVASKLPQYLKKGALKLLHLKRELVTIDDIIVKTSNSTNEIPLTASTNYAKADGNHGSKQSKPAYDASSVKSKFFDHVTKTILPGHYAPGREVNIRSMPITFPFENKEPLTCAACSKSGHSALRCKDSSVEFRKNVEQKKLCPLCLSPDHPIANCTPNRLCIYCGGMHHTGGCPQKEFYRDLANYTKEAKPRQTLFRERSKTTQSK